MPSTKLDESRTKLWASRFARPSWLPLFARAQARAGGPEGGMTPEEKETTVRWHITRELVAKEEKYVKKLSVRAAIAGQGANSG